MGPRELPSRLGQAAGRLTAREVDWLAVLATFVVATLKVGRAVARGHPVVALVLLPFATLPLLWRRTYPGAVLLVLGTVFAAAFALYRSAPSNVGLLFALYAAARYGGSRVRLLSGFAAALLTAIPVVMLIIDGTGAIPRRSLTTSLAVGMGAAWLAGELARTRRTYLHALEERAARLARDRGEHARRAAEQERMRIARELHDVVTHNVSVIAVQADAAIITADSHPGRASEALDLIQRTARDTLHELRVLLGVLRATDRAATGAPLRPSPSLSDLGELIEQTGAGGVHATIEVVGTPIALDATADLAAFRVVQEALANAVRHAPGAAAEVHLRWSARTLDITVRTSGGRHLPNGPAGYGLIGLEERVRMLGGGLDSGPDGHGGFAVHARIPVDREEPRRETGAVLAEVTIPTSPTARSVSR
ncbi:MAG TPA: histidine kinase [Solirubrobacteraceae bacterium]|nr:histidine kinase [Solirubrobacteraceae bacterium]